MAQHRATLGGEHVPLTPKEFKILATLAASPGTVLSREQLVEAAWGPEFVGETSSITVFIKKPVSYTHLTTTASPSWIPRVSASATFIRTTGF